MLHNRVRSAALFGMGVLAILSVACGSANAAPPAQSTTTPATTATTSTGTSSTPTSSSTIVPPIFTPTPVPGVSQVTSDIGVVGTGRVFAAPDTALANLGVELEATTLDQATKDARTRMDAVLAKIKSLGVDAKDITTVSYYVNPISNQTGPNQLPKVIGYHVSNIAQVRIRKIDDVGKILDAAIAAGANSLQNLTFTVDNPSSFQDQARSQAVKDAMAKAKTLADAGGVTLGKVTSISENVSVIPIIQKGFPAGLGAGGGGGGPGPVETGQNQIMVNVEMHFQIVQ